MTKPISNRSRRTYFNNPLVEESIRHLPAALEYQTSAAFRDYLKSHLHHNSQLTRERMARYIADRFAYNGAMNLELALALRTFGNSRIGQEIFYFEYIQSIPLLQELALRWLAELPEQGANREGLIGFLENRLGGRSIKKVAQSALTAFKQLGRLRAPRPGYYHAVWSEPPLEAFLYILARLYPERTMVRVDLFSRENVIRAMLWLPSCVPDMLKAAERAGHISKISQLDQYHQFTLFASGEERMRMLLGEISIQPVKEEISLRATRVPEKGQSKKKTPSPGDQLDLFRHVAKRKVPKKEGRKSNVGSAKKA